jgi:hypothetical protein
MASLNQYAYADHLYRRTVVAESELRLRGTYADSGTYSPRDAIDFQGAKYIALISVSGTAPEGNHSDYWSALAMISQGPADPFVEIRAEIAAVESIAVSGSNLAWTTYQMVGSLDYIRDEDRTVHLNHVDFGTGTNQISAVDVPYSSLDYPNVAAALNYLLYVPLQLTSFTNTVGTVEIGQTVSSVTLNWVFNKDVTGQSINQGIGVLPVAQRSYADAGTWTANRTYTLSATDGTTPVNGNTSISFSNKRYWGVSNQSTLNDAQIIALNGEFASSRSQSRTLTAAAEYVYFAYPAAWGAATFTVNGLPNTAWTLTVISFTNASGYASSYNLYRSDNLLTGTYQIVVS